MINKKKTVLASAIALSLLTSACGNAQTSDATNVKPSTTASNEVNSKTLTLKSDGTNYSLPLKNADTEKYNFVANTTEGVVWIPAPEMTLVNGSNSSPTYTPERAFTLYYNQSNEKNLTIDNSKKLLSLPLNDGEAKVIVTDLIGLGDNVVYHTSSVFTDGSQPLKEEVWTIDVKDPSTNKKILEYHSTGGKFYSYGADKDNQLYAGVSEISGNADGSSAKEVTLFDAKNNKVEQLENFELKDNKLSIEYSGNKIVFELTNA